VIVGWLMPVSLVEGLWGPRSGRFPGRLSTSAWSRACRRHEHDASDSTAALVDERNASPPIALLL
jgi:hypothetical protein